MTRRGRTLALALGGVAFGALDAYLIATSGWLEARAAFVAMALLIGWGFIGVGTYAWARRPDNRVGALMTATGFAFLLGMAGHADNAVLFTFAGVLSSVFLATAVHLLLAFPSGRLSTAGDRRIVISGYLLTTLGVLPVFLFAEPAEFGCDGCPENLLLVSSNETVFTVLGVIVNLAATVLVIAVGLSLVKRWKRATVPQRRLLTPVYWAGIALMATVVVSMVLQSADTSKVAITIAWVSSMVPFGLVPYLFLASLVRARMLQGGQVGELVERLGAEPERRDLRDALARALGDPSLQLVFWLPDDGRWVDSSGHPVELPEPGGYRAVTPVERDGERVAALVHDASLLEDPEHVRAVGAAAALALENDRLEAELRAKVEELYESRARLVRAALSERRRLERNLHDGAQQRLVSTALSLRLARTKMEAEPDTAQEMLDAAERELDAALGELRELARGIHPALLSDRGLPAALEALAHRAPLPVDLDGIPDGPLPEAVELAAYFVVAEALTNVAKYANASRARVRLGRDDGRLVVEVADDGVGGADPGRGSGLRGLADRLSGVDGRLEVDSRPGAGTRVTARIPCG